MLTTKGTYEKYKTKSEKVIVLDYKKKKIDNPNYKGYKGSKANPNYKGSNYDPNYTKSTWVNYYKKGEKPRNSNYKGKNYIPNYNKKVAQGVFTFNSKKDKVKVKKDTIIEKKHIWVLANELCLGNDTILDNLALLLYIENRVKRQILYYWSKFLGIKKYKSKLKTGLLYVELHLKLRLLKSKRLNKLKKYLGFIENIYKYVLCMSQYALLDKNMKDIFFRYALLINYLISDLNKLKFNNSVNYMSENYRGILFSLKKIYVEYSYSLFGNVKKNIFKSKSISYYLDSLILLFETKRKKDNFLQEKGFKSIGDYYFYNFWTSVSNLYVKHPMSLAELRSRNYKSFRLDDWKAYIASRKEKFNSFKSIFYKKTKKTIRSDQHIFLSKAYPFLKRNMEIKYHRFIYAYTRKLAAAKYVLNIKNILIEYLVDKVSVNAYRIKKNISRYCKDAEEKVSLVTPRRIVKLSERYTYYPRKEYVSKKEKKLRDGFVREYYEEFDNIISQEYIKDKAYRRYTNSTNRSIIIRKKKSKNYSLKAWWLRPLVKDYYIYNKRILGSSSLLYKNYINSLNFVKSIKKVSKPCKKKNRSKHLYTPRCMYQLKNVVDFGIMRNFKATVSKLTNGVRRNKKVLYYLMDSLFNVKGRNKNAKPRNISSIKKFLYKIYRQKLTGDYDSTYYSQYREYEKLTGWVSYSKRNEIKNLRYLYNSCARIAKKLKKKNAPLRKTAAQYKQELIVKKKTDKKIIKNVNREKKLMINEARRVMVTNTNNSYYDDGFTKFLSSDYDLNPYELNEKITKRNKKERLSRLTYKVLLRNSEYIDTKKNILKKRKVMHNMLFHAL